jgi:hypothetical protein
MPDPNLSQLEANALIAVEKLRTDDAKWDFPIPGRRITVPLTSLDKRENFQLDLSRQEINLNKIKYQNRARQVFVLLRLDLGGSSHCNPDGSEVACPHLHVYREGWADKWAEPAPVDKFPNLADPWAALQDFMRYCNITKAPDIERGLFI